MILLSFCFFLITSPFLSRLKAQTTFGDGSGVYSTMLNDLKKSLYENPALKKVTLDGKERLMFVSWIRDHIHTMKAYIILGEGPGQLPRFLYGEANT